MKANCLHCNESLRRCTKKEWHSQNKRLLHKECWSSLKKTHGATYIKNLVHPPCPVCTKHTYTAISSSGDNLNKMYAKCRDCEYYSFFGYDQTIDEVELIDCAQCAHTTYIRTPLSGYQRHTRVVIYKRSHQTHPAVPNLILWGDSTEPLGA